MTQWEREEDQLDRDLAEGLVTPEEHRKQLRELQQDYRDSARGAAEDAYERELDRW